MNNWYAVIAEALALAPQMIAAGIDIANFLTKAREALDSKAAPDDVDWQTLDQQVNDLRRRLHADPPG